MNTGSNGFGPKAENTNPNQHSARYGKPPTGDFVLTGDSVSELSHALADLEAGSADSYLAGTPHAGKRASADWTARASNYGHGICASTSNGT